MVRPGGWHTMAPCRASLKTLKKPRARDFREASQVFLWFTHLRSMMIRCKFSMSASIDRQTSHLSTMRLAQEYQCVMVWWIPSTNVFLCSHQPQLLAARAMRCIWWLSTKIEVKSKHHFWSRRVSLRLYKSVQKSQRICCRCWWFYIVFRSFSDPLTICDASMPRFDDLWRPVDRFGSHCNSGRGGADPSDGKHQNIHRWEAFETNTTVWPWGQAPITAVAGRNRCKLTMAQR